GHVTALVLRHSYPPYFRCGKASKLYSCSTASSLPAQRHPLLAQRLGFCLPLPNASRGFPMTERDRMVSGALYDPMDAELCTARQRARRLLDKINAHADHNPQILNALVRELIPEAGPEVWIQPPFYCDYGNNILLSGKVFFNFN